MRRSSSKENMFKPYFSKTKPKNHLPFEPINKISTTQQFFACQSPFIMHHQAPK